MIVIFLIVVSLLSHWQWITSFSILTWGDWIYQDPQTLREFLSIPTIWSSNGLGEVNIGISFTPFQVIYSILAFYHFGYGLSERIVFLWPILIFSPLCSYFFLKKNVKNSIAAIIGSFVYCYNTYFLVIRTGHLTLLTAYAFIPLALLFFQLALEKKSVRYSLLAGIAGFIVSYYEFRAFYILAFILFLYFLFATCFILKIKSIKNFLLYATLAVIPIIIIILLNAYWLLAFVKTGTLTSNVFFDRSLFGNEFLNINYSFSLFHPFWTGKRTTEFIIQPIPFSFLLIPIIAFTGMVLNMKRKIIIFWGFLSLFGIFLAKQVGQPFTGIYPWLYTHFVGFNAFREATKFFSIVALGYAVLIASFIDSILSKWQDGRKRQWGYIICFCVAMLFLWNLKPVITSEIATLFIPRQMPSGNFNLNVIMQKDPEFYRTLWVPTTSRWNAYTSIHPQVSILNQINGSWSNYVDKEKKKDKYTESDLALLLLHKPYAKNLLAISSIKYIIIPVEDKKNDDNFFKYYGKPEYFKKQFVNTEYIEKINFTSTDITVFRNKEVKPHAYITEKMETIFEELPYKKVQYVSVNGSEHHLHISNVNGTLFLNFSEAYHPNWKIRVGNFNWYDSIQKKEYFLSEIFHKKNDAQLNSYIINVEKTCTKFMCKKNNNGTYDLDVTIYFQSQSYVYIGLIVTSITAFFLVIFFISCLRNFLYEKQK